MSIFPTPPKAKSRCSTALKLLSGEWLKMADFCGFRAKVRKGALPQHLSIFTPS